MAGTYGVDILRIAHKGSSCHKTEILESTLCGCFYCKQTYSPFEINEWIKDVGGETALCPKCGIDAVLSSKYPIADNGFLDEMNRYWF